MPSRFIPEAILKSDDALAGLASKIKLQMVGEKVIALAAYAMQRQATPEQAK